MFVGESEKRVLRLRDLRLKCIEFGGVYNNHKNLHKNGSSDFDVFKAALYEFEKTTPTCKAFPYVKPWLKLKDPQKWKKQTEGTSQTSSGSKRSRNPYATSQQSDGQTHIDINDDPIDLENEQSLRRLVGRNKAKKKKVDKYNRYVQIQETKAEMMSQVEHKMIEAQISF
uniref:No apical meristem-associated C-terminal domain-containing protein n=1 Tax=Lactuca sativa TaxID=4236 RepID=A0A9R1WS24_LACSA|nr:hypothetical protein LSAT_V11C100048640 [Lactuca sativa]